MYVHSNCMFCKGSVNIHIWHFLSKMHTRMHARSHTLGWWEVKTVLGFFLQGWHSVLVSLLLCLISVAISVVVCHPQLEQKKKDTAIRKTTRGNTQLTRGLGSHCYRQVVTEKLHDQGAVFMGIGLNSVQHGDGVIKGLEDTDNTHCFQRNCAHTHTFQHKQEVLI